MWGKQKKKKRRDSCAALLPAREPGVSACLSNCPPAAAAAFVWGRESEQRERENQSGVVAKNRIWRPLQSLHCLDQSPVPSSSSSDTCVLPDTLFSLFIYIFLFSFPFLLIYLFISYISCAFVLLPLLSTVYLFLPFSI